MKTNDKKSLATKDVKELSKEVEKLRSEIDQTRLKQLAGKLKNVHQLTILRKNLAVVLTILREKQLIEKAMAKVSK